MGLMGIKKSVEDLKSDLDKIKTAMKESMGLTEEECDGLIEKEMTNRTNRNIDERTALEGVVRSMRAQVRGERLSPAATFDGYILGDRGSRDRNDQLRRQIMDDFRQDADQAIKDNKVSVNEGGIPTVLDTRPTQYGRANVRLGQELLSEYQRWIYGVAARRPGGDPKVFRLQVRDRVAVEEIPTGFVPTSFRANVGEDGAEVMLKHSNRTRFRQREVGNDCPPIEDVLESDILDDYVFKLDELEAAAEKCNDWNFFVVTVCDVLNVGEKSGRFDNIPVTVWDDSIEGKDETRTVWVPTHLQDCLTFGAGSRIVVTGRARQSTYKDETIYSINADGIYALPEYVTEGNVLEA